MLPQIHRQVIIDGTIDGQPGIVLNGANQAQNGLRLYDGSDGSVVRGMIIQDFTEAGIDIKDSDDVTIAGNWIGLDAAGTGAAANGTGVRMANSEGTLIGGTTPADRNVISGNSGVGVRLAGAGTTNNTIAGNYIGLDASGAVAIGNGWEGVHIGNGASGNTIGGANASARNVISGNGRFGINITASGAGAANNVVQHNYIGTDATGVAAVSNGNFGIVVDFSASNTTIRDNLISGNTNFDVNLSSRAGGIYVSAAGATIQGNRIGLDANGAVLANGSAGAGAGSSAGIFEAGSSHDVEIGGTNALDANIIAGNIGAGVIVNAPGGISILGNSIHANTGLGIDLGGTGVVTENDPHDTDTGPNSLQNFPELEQALSYSSGELLIRGTLDSNSGRFYRIEFFASADGDASGHGEGQSYLGFVEVETDSTGAAAFTATLAAVIPPGHVISATATRLSGASGAPIETSEFAANIIVQTVLVVDTVSDAADGDTTSIAALLAGRGSDGRISLREALEAINTQPAGSEPVRIEFAIPGGEVHIITLGDLLPAIKRPIILDATTDDSFAHNGNRPAIVLDGGGSVEDGLDLREGSDGSTIRGLIIQNFTADGIDIARSHGNTIVGNWIGLDASGIASAGNQQAVNIWDADNNTIGGVAPGDRNVLSGNLRFGIAIGGSSSGNQIIGNYIGTNVAGTAALANGSHGIRVRSAGNTIGGVDPGARNIISGNGGDGVNLRESASNSVVLGNYIGLNTTGSAAIGNGGHGINVDAVSGNQIGGSSAAERNVVSGNGLDGIRLGGPGATNNMIVGNTIGLDSTGQFSVSQSGSGDGIRIDDGAHHNIIGGNAPGAGNLISGNRQRGVFLNGSGTDGNIISGNYIGLDASGQTMVGNGKEGVRIDGGASHNIIGGDAEEDRNVISGNGRFGVHITLYESGGQSSRDPTDNIVQGNYIGSKADGTGAVSNGGFGVVVDYGASGARIIGNLIAGNTSSSDASQHRGGIYLFATGAVIQGNTISGNGSVDSVGRSGGIVVAGNNPTGSVLIGGSAAGEGNTIEGNGGPGVDIDTAGSVTIQGNTITRNIGGSNRNGGVVVTGDKPTASVLIGGIAAPEANTIADNAGPGVAIDTPGTVPVTVLGNSIHGNTGLGIDLRDDGVTENGSDTAGPNNLQNFPVLGAATASSDGQAVVTGTLDSPAGTYRIELFASASADGSGYGEGETCLGFIELTVDGTGPAGFTFSKMMAPGALDGQVISATATRLDAPNGNPLETSEFAANIRVQTVLIVDTLSDDADSEDTTSIAALLAHRGTDGKISLREAITAINSDTGAAPVLIEFSVTGTITLSAMLPAITNPVVISGPVELFDVTDPSKGNRPLIILDGQNAVSDGIRLYTGSSGSTIRGLAIRGFLEDGIDIASSDNNTVAGNWLGLGLAGANQTGVNIWDSSNNVVGGLVPADRNVISGNSAYGIQIGRGGTGTATGNQVLGNYIGTNVTGTAALANGNHGIRIRSEGNIIGGSTAGARNVISGNANDGIKLLDRADDNIVLGNHIGLSADGSTVIGNGGHGVEVASGTVNRIGGLSSADGNVIAGNGRAGVAVAGAAQASILGNSIYDNTGLGIDLLGNVGPDVDIEATHGHLQNFPILNEVRVEADQLFVSGSLQSAASGYYRIEFFASPSMDSSGYGEGRSYVGHIEIETDGSSHASFDETLSLVGVPAGYEMVSATATATRSVAGYGSFTQTSEFSPAVAARAPNTAPEGTDRTVQADEDVSYTFKRQDFGFADVTDDDGFKAVRVGTLPAAGVLTLDGVAVIAGQFVSVQDIDAGLLVFAPAPDANGSAYASFSFRVQDDGGTALGGQDLDQTPRTLTIDVGAVNDAPGIVPGHEEVALGSIAEDTIAPAGETVGDLFGDAFSDARDQVAGGSSANVLAGVAVVGNAATDEGRWQWHDGSAWQDIDTDVSVSGALVLSTGTELRFVPAADWNGTPGELTIRLIDDSHSQDPVSGDRVDLSGANSGGSTQYSDASNEVVLGTKVTPEQDAFDDTANTTSGQPVEIDVLANDPFEGGNKRITQVGGQAITEGNTVTLVDGSTVKLDDGKLVFTSSAGYVGLASFEYTATTDTGIAETATVTVTVAENPTTITGDTTGSGQEDAGPITGQLTATDLDGLHATMPYVVSTEAVNGTATIDADGRWSYTPNADWHGTDSFEVTVTDALNNTVTQLVMVTVAPEQDAFDDTANTTSAQPVTIDVLANDPFEGSNKRATEVDGQAISEGGTVAVTNGNVKLEGGNLVFTSTAGYVGDAVFTYTATTDTGVAETAAVTVTVAENPTTITGDTTGSGDEDGGAITGQLSATDLDGLHATMPYAVSTPATNGTATIDTDGRWSYTPNADWYGTDQFTVTVTDALGHETTQVVTLAVDPVNDAPRIVSDGGLAQANLVRDENTSAVTQVVATDVDGDGVHYSLAGGADAAHFRIDAATGHLSFAVAPDFEAPHDANRDGIYEVIVRASDPAGAYAQQVLHIVVADVNEVPTANPDQFEARAGQPAVITATRLLANDVDVDGDRLEVIAVSDVQHGELVLTDTGVWVYTPAAGFYGTDRFTYIVADPDGLTATAEVLVTVLPIGDGGNTGAAPGNPATPPGLTPPDSSGPGAGGDAASGGKNSSGPEPEPIRPGRGNVSEAAPRSDEPWGAWPDPLARPGQGGTSGLRGGSTPFERDQRTILRDRELEARSWVVADHDLLSGGNAPDQLLHMAAQRALALLQSASIDGPSRETMRALAVFSDMLSEASGERLDTTRVVSEVMIGGSVLTAGVVAWLLRAGALGASLLSTLPVWSTFDPIPVIYRRRRRDEEPLPSAPDAASEAALARVLRPGVRRQPQEAG